MDREYGLSWGLLVCCKRIKYYIDRSKLNRVYHQGIVCIDAVDPVSAGWILKPENLKTFSFVFGPRGKIFRKKLSPLTTQSALPVTEPKSFICSD